MLIYKPSFTETEIHFLFFFPPEDSGKVNRKKKKTPCKREPIIHY